MVIIGVILLTLLTPFVVLGLGYFRIRRGPLLFLAPISTLIAFVLVFINGEKLPISFILPNLSPSTNYIGSHIFLLDNISWPFVIAILALVLVTFFMDIAHLENPFPNSWAFIQFIGGLGIIAVLAGNPLTIIIAWVMIDITEFVVLLNLVPSSHDREKIVISLSVRITGIILLISAIIIAQGMGIMLSFDEIPRQVSALLIFAAGLRLAVFPTNQLYLQEAHKYKYTGTAISFISSIAGIVIGVRASSSAITDDWFVIIIILSTIVVILSSMYWIQTDNSIKRLSNWILVYGMFSLVAAAQGLQYASLAWALAMVFPGALLFSLSQINRWILLLIYLGGIGFSALPLTPTWEGSVQIFSLPLIFRIIFYIVQALMIFGFLRLPMQSTERKQGVEKWLLIVYSIGLVILPIVHFGLVYLMWMFGLRDVSFQSSGWWSGVISTGIAVFLLIRFRDKSIFAHSYLSKFTNLFKWIFRSFWWGYRYLGRILYFVSRLLEGDGSVLWALLILILLTVTISIWGNGDIFEL